MVKGFHHTKKTIEKLRLINSGENNAMYSKHHTQEAREKMRFTHLGENNYNFGKHFTEEHRKKIGLANLGKSISEETKGKLRLANKGHIPWNKGKTGIYSEEVLKKMGSANLGKHRSDKTKSKISISRLGKPLSEETKKRMSIAQLGKSLSEETKRKISIANTGKCRSEEFKEKNRIAHLGKVAGMKGKHFTKEQLRKILHRRIPTSLEEKFQSIVNKYNLPYKYVGDGSFIIGGYNPDFINTNNEKIAIEVYARYYKRRNHTSIEDWKIQRAKVFKQYGWEVMYFDEIEVNEDNIKNKLNEVKI